MNDGYVPLHEVKQLHAIESNLLVATAAGVTILQIASRSADATFFVRMPVGVWREFCRRQLAAIPPPQPFPEK